MNSVQPDICTQLSITGKVGILQFLIGYAPNNVLYRRPRHSWNSLIQGFPADLGRRNLKFQVSINSHRNKQCVNEAGHIIWACISMLRIRCSNSIESIENTDLLLLLLLRRSVHLINYCIFIFIQDKIISCGIVMCDAFEHMTLGGVKLF